MLLVDDRIGSRDLLGPLQRYGVPAESARLEFGDFAFVGRGLADAPVAIGIELKETKDLIHSLQSSRFPGHQLPGLLNTYDRVWLVSEGIWRATEDGILEIMSSGWRTVKMGNQPIMARDLESWILSQVIRGGIGYWHCPTRRDTIRFISVLYHWWTNKTLEQHRSHQAIYTAPPDRATFVEPSETVRMIVGIDGVGWDRATKLEERFGTLEAVMAASIKELQKTVGKVTGERVWYALRGGRKAA